jgi:choline-sulfatase
VRSKPAKPPRSRLWLIGAIAGVVVLVLGFASVKFLTRDRVRLLGPGLELSPGAAAGYNVMLITLDTTRADRVGCYGYQGVQTPTIDALAAGGVRFADAVSVVPMTLPAHASILTGDYPPTHGVRDNGTYRLNPEFRTLATDLKSAGYATAAFIGAFVLDARYGLNRGFDVYDDDFTSQAAGPDKLNPQRRGDLVVDSAVRWLDDQQKRAPGQRFFTWVHLFDPHMPYDAPEPFKSRYLKEPYDGEIAFVDQQVGRVVEKVRALGQLEKTVVVLVGDHGEGLGDHGESSHSLLIYAATVNVPLIFYAPGLVPAGKVVSDRVVATIDLAPTILELLGLPVGKCDGISLLRPTDTDRAVYVETLAPQLNHGWSPLFSMRRHVDKYIESPRPEYFDLRSDPREITNLWGENARQATALAERLAGVKRTLAESSSGGSAMIDLDPAARRKLESLGYIGSTSGAAEGPLPDPKEMVARTDEQTRQATLLMAGGRAAEAIPLIRQLLSIMPGDASLWSLLTVAQAQTGLLDDAIASRLKLLDLQPTDAQSWVALASLQDMKGDVEASKVSLAEAERVEPDLGSIYMVRARQLRQAGKLEEALAMCAEAVRRDPTRYSADSWSLQAEIYESLGKPAEAAAARQRARQAGAP